MSLIRVQHLHKTYRLGRVDVPVLRGCTLDVQHGEWLAVLGASGSGKSTLLHLMGGLDRPDRAKARTCPNCKYDLSRVEGDVCPECGNAINRGGNIRFNDDDLGRFSQRQLNR